MSNLYILTTAINRPDLHNNSIGHMYSNYLNNEKDDILKRWNRVIHIINIDKPPNNKLDHITQQMTAENFRNIIPEWVEINFIIPNPETSSLLNAYKNLMTYLKINNGLDINHNYWWLEDDWYIHPPKDIFLRVIPLFKKNNITPIAITMTVNHQLGSFRGGPIMSGTYFLRFFNLVELGLLKVKKNPERQYRSFLSGKDCYANQPHYHIHRQLDINKGDTTIHLVLINTERSIPRISPDFGINYYHIYFNTDITLRLHSVFIQRNDLVTPNEHDRWWYANLGSGTSGQIDPNQVFQTIRSPAAYQPLSPSDFFALHFFHSESIVLFVVKPYCIKDIGRDYMANLAKEP
tara:strand:- start:1694 stop:2740 length:1047 start_codon:yes stop_codon:yes gene_type:complete